MADESVEKGEETAGADAPKAGETEPESAVSTADPGVGPAEKTESGEAGATPEAAETGPAGGDAIPARVIQPDVRFVRDVINAGGSDLKKCYQCATCSVACNITPDDTPFPRKEMQWAQWGLKEKLTGSPDIWLCHQCNDCTAQCPRDAKPGTVMQAIAKMTIANYSISSIAKAVGSAKTFVLMALLPVIIIMAAIGIQGHFSNVPRGGNGAIVYSEFMNVYRAIDPIFTIFFVIAAVLLILGGRRYWNDMLRNHVSEGGAAPEKGFFGNLWPTVTEFLAHKRFRKCDETRDRANSHLLVFYAFVGLLLTTAWAGLYMDVIHRESPFPMYDPIKILANISAAAGIIGITMVLIYKFTHAGKIGRGSYYDWWLIGTIYVLLLTGIGSELLREANTAVFAYPVYSLHLMTVLFLFIYAPFSKMAHMVYRMVALVFARATGRDLGVE